MPSADLLLTGIGGQGIQLCAKTLALAGTAEGLDAMLTAHYGGQMRGGMTEATVVLREEQIDIRRKRAAESQLVIEKQGKGDLSKLMFSGMVWEVGADGTRH